MLSSKPKPNVDESLLQGLTPLNPDPVLDVRGVISARLSFSGLDGTTRTTRGRQARLETKSNALHAIGSMRRRLLDWFEALASLSAGASGRQFASKLHRAMDFLFIPYFLHNCRVERGL
jgi:hypothetical protein